MLCPVLNDETNIHRPGLRRGDERASISEVSSFMSNITENPRKIRLNMKFAFTVRNIAPSLPARADLTRCLSDASVW
jgi:hypothetical protein